MFHLFSLVVIVAGAVGRSKVVERYTNSFLLTSLSLPLTGQLHSRRRMISVHDWHRSDLHPNRRL